MAANTIKFPPEGPFDDDYLARLRSGDYETAQHFNAYFRKLLRIMLCGVFSPDVVNDLIDEVMFVAITNVMKGEPRDAERLPQYVRGVCNKLKAKWIHAKGKALRQDIDVERVAGSGDTAEDLLRRQDIKRAIQTVLMELSERDRYVLTDLFYNELTRDQLCAKYGPISRDQLRMILFHALRRFQRKWREKNETQ